MTVIYRTWEEGDSNYFELINNNEFYLIMRVHESEVRLYSIFLNLKVSSTKPGNLHSLNSKCYTGND